ncbi:hypothetical protein K435DRAFT_873023 [Dendrothele bispora CBS 962.96]|uniref:Uncharacterized protein n=1 Tax=Dendrothele bispora (strain CBS 962.96) TaxID=1314807 RepID=A0A4S8L056_DENBC|nr:hypothetical protein K435DRAFT_873023 [Dendrothele bispora CBS 962.96]
MTRDNHSNISVKREDSSDILNETRRSKHIQRDAAQVTISRISQALGPGGYLNSQTTDTQFFGFSQSACENGLQDIENLEMEDDSSEYQFTQSQIADNFEFTESQVIDDIELPEVTDLPKVENGSSISSSSNHVNNSYPGPLFSPNMSSEPSSHSHALAESTGDHVKSDNSWVPNGRKQRYLRDLISAEYPDHNLHLDLIGQAEARAKRKGNWGLIQKAGDNDPTTHAIHELNNAAGVNCRQILQAGQQLQRGHLMVAGYMITLRTS